MVSKALVVGAYQSKLAALSKFPGVELHVVVPPSWKGPEGETVLEEGRVAGYRLNVSPIRFNGHFHLHYYPELPRLMGEINPDLLHFDEEPYNLSTYLGLRAGRAAGARLLFFSWQNLLRWYPWPFRAMERACYRWADGAIAGNEDASHVLRRKGYRGHVEIIPQFGIVPEDHPPRDTGSGTGDIVRIGYAGRLVPEKGVSVLLEAVAGLTGDWRLIIAGSGPLEPELIAHAGRLGISDRTEFCGKLPSGQMPAFMNRLDVLVLPSLSRPNWTEQFGRVLIEGMASEVAVVGSSCGEIPRVIGDAGLLFPEGDATALRRVLQLLLEDRSLRTGLANMGRQRALTHFTQDAIAEKTYHLYRSILHGAFEQCHSVV